jgi:hypothetical protein
MGRQMGTSEQTPDRRSSTRLHYRQKHIARTCHALPVACRCCINFWGGKVRFCRDSSKKAPYAATAGELPASVEPYDVVTTLGASFWERSVCGIARKPSTPSPTDRKVVKTPVARPITICTSRSWEPVRVSQEPARASTHSFNPSIVGVLGILAIVDGFEREGRAWRDIGTQRRQERLCSSEHVLPGTGDGIALTARSAALAN